MHHVVVGLTWLKKRLAALGLKRRNVVETRLTLVHQAITGPNWCWHIDGYDKLKPFGFPIHACIDGFSRKIIWLELTATNNDPNVVVKFYLDAVVKLEAISTLPGIRGSSWTFEVHSMPPTWRRHATLYLHSPAKSTDRNGLMYKCKACFHNVAPFKSQRSEPFLEPYEESEDYIKDVIASPESAEYLETLPTESFQHVFWQQQVQAASMSNPRGMRWHPLHDDTLVPLSETQSSSGFSTDVDKMLMDAARITTCPEREKYVILLLDEMHVRDDLVYDKHSGKMIGFANLGEVNNHLSQYEQLLQGDTAGGPQVAKTVVVFMVRGLFSKLQFPYAQFPCHTLAGSQLYDPFWEAVGRLENCGFKVLCITLDGASPNRLVKLHQSTKDVVYKVANPFTLEKRYVYFISDPPHLMKTMRNCLKSRNFWFDGKCAKWDDIVSVYRADNATGWGVQLIPKLNKGNCCGGNVEMPDENVEPLPKWRCSRSKVHHVVTKVASTSPDNDGILMQAIKTMQADSAFSLTSENFALQIAAKLSVWIPLNLSQVDAFEQKVQKCKQVDLMLCLDGLLEDESEEQNESTDWLKAINRGGLLYVNSMTFELFLTMERELRFHLSSNPEFGGSDIKIHLKQSEDVLFLWAIIGAGWEEEYCTYHLGMVVDMWVCIRGFSQATAWIERYKSAQKKNLQKAKPLRKKQIQKSVAYRGLLLFGIGLVAVAYRGLLLFGIGLVAVAYRGLLLFGIGLVARSGFSLVFW
eukprot:Em0017g466a